MRYLPILVDLAGRPCLVVGGGAVAARKAEQLLGVGARVTVVATRVGAAMAELERVGPALRIQRRPYRPDDLDGAALAFAATDDPDLQEAIARQARAAGVWLNAVDEPERCSFVMPAILDRDPLVVAVSTSGASPALARRVRDDLDAALGPEYDAAVATLARLRGRYAPGRPRQEALVRLVDEGLLDALRGGDERRVDELIAATCAGLPEQDAGVERAR
ncbi:MAG: bifunctional precorrin-2 dehydrogenase/sirohydrochlorin ferrochelatase [Deltaproteobacteria bacterium]|nr:bifunctional precorrin-2 dehydrogenase/sirohydrochlorin ferrochelatase [Deltaproteobacteria bacterium]